MKKILFLVLGFSVLQSCIIKEEISIRDTNQVDYQYALDCSNAKVYLPENYFRNEIDFMSDDEVGKLSRGMTVEQFLNFIKNKDETSSESVELDTYLKKNNKVFQKVKNDSIIFDFYDLTFITKSKSNTSNLDENGNELNNFIAELTKITRGELAIHYVSNKKVIKDKTLTVDLNKKSFDEFYTAFNNFYQSANEGSNGFKLDDFVSYQITVNTPKPIKYTNIEGNSFSFDRKSVTGNYKLNQILGNKISQIKVIYE